MRLGVKVNSEFEVVESRNIKHGIQEAGFPDIDYARVFEVYRTVISRQLAANAHSPARGGTIVIETKRGPKVYDVPPYTPGGYLASLGYLARNLATGEKDFTITIGGMANGRDVGAYAPVIDKMFNPQSRYKLTEKSVFIDARSDRPDGKGPFTTRMPGTYHIDTPIDSREAWGAAIQELKRQIVEQAPEIWKQFFFTKRASGRPQNTLKDVRGRFATIYDKS